MTFIDLQGRPASDLSCRISTHLEFFSTHFQSKSLVFC